jgi:hypothetical protein
VPLPGAPLSDCLWGQGWFREGSSEDVETARRALAERAQVRFSKLAREPSATSSDFVLHLSRFGLIFTL